MSEFSFGKPAVPTPEEEEALREQAREVAEGLGPQRPGKRYKKLEGLYGTIGLVVVGFDPICGTGILQSAQETAKAVDRLCQENAQVAKIVDRVLTGSAVMELIAAHAPIFMVVMQHHAPEGFLQGFRLPWMAPSEDGQGGGELDFTVN